ncbi:hypothetical protein SMACR_02731 [Sordaria macrospora]|uniref:WGS project CABT00000000 data, contig 2.11 n=2 Tax=Sordaria macrospora TaxID=5147 RepID=F7VXB0_SORMK|nr:uncharacterized protein SMAC_02731 [Sordaria macrospora k-hell]KAA8636332.1 hypothetical protein SMACR_02731 [Sordaria macrospora]WPJ60438.1 hypothetical protein SMAC4_02731 [Sordaria macrospora]CCC10152.1 unnamed protein product [Sordaria macrospora k-hell]
MHPITILALLTAFAAASPVLTSPRNTDSAPAPTINKRVDIYWGWFARDAEEINKEEGAGAGETRDSDAIVAEGVEGEQK